MSARNHAPVTPAARVFSAATWVLLIAGLSIVTVAQRTDPGAAQTVLTGFLTVFFLILLARLCFAAGRQPRRRGRLIVLLISVALWAAGSAVLNGVSKPDLTRFPSPGEVLFLPAYIGMIIYLIVDVPPRARHRSAGVLEAVVICGGLVCLAGSVLLAPAADHLRADGVAAMMALLYPMIDVLLAVIVTAQLVLTARAGVRRSGGLLAGFALFTIADSQFIQHLSRDTYQFSIVDIACWGLGFALIVGSACAHTSDGVSLWAQRGSTIMVVSAGVIAIVVLAFQPTGTVRDCLLGPALLTLIAAGARLVLALRVAAQAVEAFSLSRTDDLTSLPNRRAVLQTVDQFNQHGTPTGLLLIDLDGFKNINDTLGHLAGDQVLRLLAERTSARLPDGVELARLGGDEFAVIVSGCDDELFLHEVAADILAAIRHPLLIEGISVALDASVGITTTRDGSSASTEMLRRADVAMYRAKRARAGVVRYDVDNDDYSRENLALAEELRCALKDGQLKLWYQPQVRAREQSVSGLEALIRWQHPVRGLLSPIEFLPVARQVGMMQSLSEEVARIAAADLAGWNSAGLKLRVAVNCAPPELSSGLFVAGLSQALTTAGVPADQVVIEITEDTFSAEPERVRERLLQARDMGFEVSVDDYGTGFSSLSYLRDLPVQELKIDRSFVATMDHDDRSRMIVASTLQLARALGLRTVAEGVENQATAEDLTALGVDVLQGYHLAKPMPVEDVEPWLRRRDLALAASVTPPRLLATPNCKTG